jgi:uncharacterized lipoprotein YmbA
MMDRIRNAVRFAVGALLLVSFAGCVAKGLVVEEYVLAPTEVPTGMGSTSLGLTQLSLGVGPVELPDYLRRPQIVTRRGNQLHPSEAHKWGGDLGSNFARVLADNLSALIPTDRVVTFPWYDPSLLDYRVQLRVTRFEPDSEGEISLMAQWLLTDPRSSEVFHVGKSSIRQKSEGSDYAALVEAMSRAVATLARDIAAVIRTRLETGSEP